jgi:hypothetical protein
MWVGGGPNVFQDVECAEDNSPIHANISWEAGLSNAKKNWLDVGSETPQQMGRYWAVLASEYAMIAQNYTISAAERAALQQRTLEELFLGLQAYRRLDITAQCLAAQRYQEIRDGFEAEECGCAQDMLGYPPCLLHQVTALTQEVSDEVWVVAAEPTQGSCLCGAKYRVGGHNNFDVNVEEGNCNFVPRTDGYSGFFIRADATQALEPLLHDDSEERWNIDYVGCAYTASIAPPCTTIFSPTCMNVYLQNFMSQDQVIGLFIGLGVIKRFIPPTATVTTCEGVTHNVLDIAQAIAHGIATYIDGGYRSRIRWPGSDDCCEREVFLSNSEGGQTRATIHGLIAAHNYIVDEQDRIQSSHWQEQAWKAIEVASNLGTGDGVFRINLAAIGWDQAENEKFSWLVDDYNKEVLLLVNELLHYGPTNEYLPRFKDGFMEMLCSAPCGGPCRKRTGYPSDANAPNFNCSNTPGWLGDRWTGSGKDSDIDFEITSDRQFNGLDYMLLYNMYMLNYPNELQSAFDYDITTLGTQPPLFVGSEKITGPAALCLGESATYALSLPSGIFGVQGAIENVLWSSSPNISLANAQAVAAPPSASVKAEAVAALSPSYIQVDFKHVVPKVQYNSLLLGPPALDVIILQPNGTTTDVCEFSYRRPLITGDFLSSTSRPATTTTTWRPWWKTSTWKGFSTNGRQPTTSRRSA